MHKPSFSLLSRKGRRFRLLVESPATAGLLHIGAPRFELGTSCPPDTRANQAAPRPVRGNDSGCPAYPRTTDEPRPTPLLDDPDAVATLGMLLAAAGYTAEGLRESLHAEGPLGTARAEIPVHRQRLTDSGQLPILIELFFLGASVSREEGATALPELELARLEEIGVLRAQEDGYRSTLRLVPHREVVVAYEAGAEPPPGTDLLANLTVRMHFVSALQPEAGSGLHALLAARHTDRAVATDPDPRALELTRFGALLNGLENLETLAGPGVEPVAGHSFGLVAANPSRLLTPDDDERADSLCRELVQAVAAQLSEGGFAHLLVTWILGPGEDWWSPLEHWLEGRACDALLLLEREDDPISYSALYAGEGELDRWTTFLAGLAADRVATGAIVLRRRTRAGNWTRHEELPSAAVGPAGDQVVRAFVNHDLLASTPDADQLLEEILAVVEPQRIEQTWRHRDEGLELESARARLDWGLGFTVGIDTYTIELLARIDGRRRLRELFAEIAEDSQLEEEVVARAGLPAVRRLLELGFLARAV
jgi:hypothetical protein